MSRKQPTDPIPASWRAATERRAREEAERKDRRRRLAELDAAFQAFHDMSECKTNADIARVFARLWGHLARLLDANPDLVVVPLEKITAEPEGPKEYALRFVRLVKAGNETEAAAMLLEILERWNTAPDMISAVLDWLQSGLGQEIRGKHGAILDWLRRLEREIRGEDLDPSATEAKVEQEVSAAPATGEPETKGKRINERILATVQQNPDSVGWAIREWATHLGCSISTIQATRAWEMIRKSRALDAADSGVNRERERRRSRRRSVED